MEKKSRYGKIIWSIGEDFDAEEESLGKYILIDLVYTKPRYRGKGYARKLLLSILPKLRATGLPVKLAAYPKEASVDWERLVSFYESVGFEALEEDQGGPAVIMTL
jgi:GNAT superfamily N-acetyltransferase